VLVELCVNNYATFDDFVNGVNDIFKASTIYCEKIIIWIMFQNSKIGTLIREKYNHYHNNNIESKWTPIEPIIKYIKVGKSQSFIITKIQFPIQLATTKTIHHF
jgi:phosphopantetheine adenylyltransferase